ncbi:MAG: winged helix-turn-helix domain-containing protein, partial [Acidobacteriaceae bacterium]|nr:winged helix-turn-helix domain-containing protein [Acidobacteriaceae bacterium]
LRFGTFELDLASSELRKNGALVKLQSQQFQLLALLAARPGQIITRDEIRRALWDDQTFVDFDRSINFGINQIRSALADDPQSPRYIETLPRKGYRFIAPIECGNGLVDVLPTIAPTHVSQPDQSKRWRLLAVVAMAVIAVTLAVLWGMSRLSATKPIQSLAVLPLENFSNDPEQDYFADGMTEDLITDLAKVSALRVVSRTSVARYRRTKKPIPQIARELNVDSVLEGTVMRERDRVRITAQLIRATPERHVWANKYEGSISEVLTLQDAVAKAVAHEIQVKLTPREQAILSAHRSVDPGAYEAYLRGRHLWEISGEPNLQKSREYFEQAIDKDPGYSRAWAGLADTYNYLASWGVMPSAEARPRARAAAERALQLDNSLADPIITLAEVKMNYEWDWDGAERLCRQAIRLNPQSGHAHHVYAIYLAELGRSREALNEATKARDVEPLSDVYADNLVWRLHAAHRDAEAESEWHKQFGWDLQGDYILASVYLANGRKQEALAEFRKGVTLPWAGALELMFLAHGLGVTGNRADGQKVLQQMLDLTEHRYIPPEYIAIVYEGLGERDRAIQWFEKAYAEHSMNSWILSDPRLDNIRTDPRFRDILRRMGLPQ